MNITYLKLERINKGLNQEDLAEKLKISRSYLSKIETLKHLPSNKINVKIEKFFNKPIDELLKKVEI